MHQIAFSITTLVGIILIAVIAGLSSLAGLGGGGPSIVVLILCFNYFPKDATIIVFSSILGSSFGNIINQMRKAHNKDPVLKYEYAFISLPIMFIGSFIGVFLNKLLSSLIICSVIIFTSAQSLKNIYNRFL